MTVGEEGHKYRLKHRVFCFLDSSRSKTTEWCKTRITTLALPDRTSNFLSFLPSLVNVTPRYLNFSIRFSNIPPTCKESWTKNDVVTKFWKCQFFVPAMSHAAVKPFNVCWRKI